MRYDNYPEDIRSYDHDPRSPFYDDSRERAEESAMGDVPKSLHEQCERLGLALEVNMEADADEDGPYMHTTYTVGDTRVCEEDFTVVAANLATVDREHPDFEDLVAEAVEV